MSEPSLPKTELQKKIEARKPHEKKISLRGFPGLEKDEIILRVLRKGEAGKALASALARVDELAKHVPALKEHPGFVKEQTNIALLFAATRDAKDPVDLPAFVSPAWMEQHFDTPEFDYLLRTYNRFAGEAHPGGAQHLEPGKLLALLDWIANESDGDAINDELLLFQNEILCEILIRAAVFYRDAKNEAAAERQKIEALAAAGFVPPDDGEGLAAVSETLSIFATRLLAQEPANDMLVNAMTRIRTARDAELAMSMLGWTEGSPSWKRVLGEEGGGRAS